MIGEPIPDPKDLLQAQLEAQVAQFFASGGHAELLESFEARPLPSRSDRIDPQTVLNRMPRGENK